MAHKGYDRTTQHASFASVADLSASAYHVALMDGTTRLVTVAAAAGDGVVGIFGPDIDDYSSLGTGQYGSPELIIGGRATAIAGGVIAAGVWCVATAAGHLVAASAGEMAICQTLEAAGADGDQIAVRVERVRIHA